MSKADLLVAQIVASTFGYSPDRAWTNCNVHLPTQSTNKYIKEGAQINTNLDCLKFWTQNWDETDVATKGWMYFHKKCQKKNLDESTLYAQLFEDKSMVPFFIPEMFTLVRPAPTHS